jgi:hypothetical protein
MDPDNLAREAAIGGHLPGLEPLERGRVFQLRNVIARLVLPLEVYRPGRCPRAKVGVDGRERRR